MSFGLLFILKISRRLSAQRRLDLRRTLEMESVLRDEQALSFILTHLITSLDLVRYFLDDRFAHFFPDRIENLCSWAAANISLRGFWPRVKQK